MLKYVSQRYNDYILNQKANKILEYSIEAYHCLPCIDKIIIICFLESAPDCSSSVPSEVVFGGSACGIHDNIVMSCRVEYKGNIPPVLKWRRSQDSNPNRLRNWEKETTITDSSVVSTVTFEADDAVNTYTCQADVSDTSASSCTETTEFVKTLCEFMTVL